MDEPVDAGVRLDDDEAPDSTWGASGSWRGRSPSRTGRPLAPVELGSTHHSGWPPCHGRRHGQDDAQRGHAAARRGSGPRDAVVAEVMAWMSTARRRPSEEDQVLESNGSAPRWPPATCDPHATPLPRMLSFGHFRSRPWPFRISCGPAGRGGPLTNCASRPQGRYPMRVTPIPSRPGRAAIVDEEHVSPTRDSQSEVMACSSVCRCRCSVNSVRPGSRPRRTQEHSRLTHAGTWRTSAKSTPSSRRAAARNPTGVRAGPSRRSAAEVDGQLEIDVKNSGRSNRASRWVSRWLMSKPTAPPVDLAGTPGAPRLCRRGPRRRPPCGKPPSRPG